MASRSPRAAVDAALDRLGRVTACVTARPLLTTVDRDFPEQGYVGFAPRPQPAPLRAGSGARLQLFVTHSYRVVATPMRPASHHMQTIDYRYQLLDRDGCDILAYHWHPTGISPVTTPHLHLSGRLAPLPLPRGDDPLPLGKVHLSTGFVTLADVVRLLITEFGVPPRRANWAAILAANAGPGPAPE